MTQPSGVTALRQALQTFQTCCQTLEWQGANAAGLSFQALQNCFKAQLLAPQWPTQLPAVEARLRAVLVEMHRELRLMQREISFWRVAQSSELDQAQAEPVGEGRRLAIDHHLQNLHRYSAVLFDLVELSGEWSESR